MKVVKKKGTYNFQNSTFQIPDVIAKELTHFLENQIIFGEVKPGSRLIEEDVVQLYNVSRSPVREALRSLEQEGLVVRASRRGVWVSQLGIDNLDEVYTCRLALEGLAAELAAQNRTDQDIADTIRAFDDLAQAHGNRDLRAFFHCNLALSACIHVASNNITLRRLLGSIGKQSFRYRYLAYSQAPEMMTASIEGHREIISAIEKRNARHARILMEDLIQRSWSVIRKFFVESQG